MKTRTISGACFIAIIVGFFILRNYVHPSLFNVLIWFLCAVGTYEVARAVKEKSTKFTYILSLVVGALIIPVYGLIEFLLPQKGIVIANLFLGVAVLVDAIYILVKNLNASFNSIGVFYPSVFFLSMAYTNGLEEPKGFVALLLVFVVSCSADTFAYLVGMTYNKIVKGKAKKLCPKLSPKKTIAGAIGGLIGGGVGACIVQLIVNPNLGLSLPYLFMILIGIGGSLLTEIGDLFESGIKRSVGIKDMGKIMPGHGGVMDRFDGMCFSSAFFCVVFTLI